MRRAEARENVKKYGTYLGKIINILAFLLMPVCSFVAFESVTGNLPLISADMAVLNILWMAVLYLVIFSIFQTTRIACPLASGLLFVVSLAETFVISFRGTPIMIWEVLAFSTAMTVAGNYVFEISEEMKYAGTLLLILNLLLWFFPVRVKGWKKRILAGAVSMGLAVCFGIYFFIGMIPSKNLGINMWAMSDTYQQYGYILSTAVSLKYVVKRPPQDYSTAKLNDIYSRMKEGKEEKEGEEEAAFEAPLVSPVNLICIMNESLSELKVAGDFTTNQEYFSFLNSLEENTVKGSLCVPVFGSMTSNTEFEFLLGDSMAMLPSGTIAYQFYVKPGVCSLVSTLKDQGYYSVAMHPFPRENWNRDQCYQNMGFDEFLDYDSYSDSQLIRNYVSDLSDYQKIIDAVENKESPENRLFVFNVTMQNHGGYDPVYDDFSQDVYLTGSNQGKYPKADQYLSLMKRSDEALKYLVEYFEACSEPTMIVMFGDHQPGIEDEFFDAVAGRPSSQLTAPEQLIWYQTPFVIWTNYKQPSKDMGKLGAVYLSSYMLKLAGLELTPYHNFLLEMSGHLPVVHPIGLFQPDGTYYSWQEAESPQCPYQELVLEYEYLVYNHSLDSRTVTELFSLP